jgi:hypothetical protein
MLTTVTAARKIKVAIVIDAAPFVKLGVPPDNAPPRTNIVVEVAGRTLTADVSTKSVRKAVKTLLENVEQGVTLVLQGALVAGDHVDEAGLIAQVKAKAPEIVV